MKGPKDAYDSEEKRSYRERIWATLEATPRLSSIPIKQRRVLFLDEWKAEEAKFLVARGYSPENLTLANLNVATAATAQRKLREAGINGVTAVGRDVREFYASSSLDPGFDAIHLDFCSCLSSPLIYTLEEFNGAGLERPVALAVNVLRGREGRSNLQFRNAVDSLVERCNASVDEARLRTMFLALTSICFHDYGVCRQHLVNPASGKYTSSNGQSMLWLAGELRGHHSSVLDERHLYKAMRQAKRRNRANVWPDGNWHVPECLCLLMANQINPEQANLRDGEIVSHPEEFVVHFEQRLRGLMKEGNDRKAATLPGFVAASLKDNEVKQPETIRVVERIGGLILGLVGRGIARNGLTQ